MKAAIALGVVGACLLLTVSCAALFPPSGIPWLTLLVVYLFAVGGAK